jgi:two-component system, sporulation sensor kinase A
MYSIRITYIYSNQQILEVSMLNTRLFKEFFYQSRLPQTIGKVDFSNIQYNPAFCDFIGYSMDELANLSIENLSHPDDMASDLQLFGEIASGQRSEYQIEKRYIHKSGEIKTGILTVSRVRGQSKEEEYLLAQILDITEKKKIEEELRIREEKYRLLAEHSSDVIMALGIDYTYHYISPSVRTVLGYEPVEMMGKNPFDFIHPDDCDEIRKHYQLNIRNHSMLFTYRCRKKDGTFVWLESTLKGLFNEDSRQVKEIITVSRDIQQRIETNDRLRKSEKLAVVGQTAAAVAHEIRNPLTAIKGFMQLFTDEKEINPVFMAIILDELDRVETIISEFLTMAKPHSEKSIPIQVDQLVQQVIQLLHTQALMKNKEINFIPIGAIPPIKGDPNSIKQVFMNVIQNSLDAIVEMGRIDVSIYSNPTGIFVQIVDNGCGIPKERLSKLGEPFYSTKEKGTGLGLMTCYRIIESHHGKINVESVEGEGTTVTIWFPIH